VALDLKLPVRSGVISFAAVLSDVEFICLILFYFILAEILAKNNTRRDKNAINVYTVRNTQFTTKHKI